MSDLEEMENGIRIERLNAFSLISLSLSISSPIRLIYFNRGYMLNKEQRKAIRVERRRQMLSGTGKYKNRINKQTAHSIYKLDRSSSENFYKSSDWKIVKDWLFRRYKYRCVCCGVKRNLHVDHIIPISINPEYCLRFENLQYLCETCNKIKSNNTNKKFTRYTRFGKEKSFYPPEKELLDIESRWVNYFPKLQ